jgi:hypothetical protein
MKRRSPATLSMSTGSSSASIDDQVSAASPASTPLPASQSCHGGRAEPAEVSTSELPAGVLGVDLGPADRDDPDLAGVPADVDAADQRDIADMRLVREPEQPGHLADGQDSVLRDPMDPVGPVIELPDAVRIARRRPEREDARVRARDDAIRLAEPDLSDRRILPGSGRVTSARAWSESTPERGG